MHADRVYVCTGICGSVYLYISTYITICIYKLIVFIFYIIYTITLLHVHYVLCTLPPLHIFPHSVSAFIPLPPSMTVKKYNQSFMDNCPKYAKLCQTVPNGSVKIVFYN